MCVQSKESSLFCDIEKAFDKVNGNRVHLYLSAWNMFVFYFSSVDYIYSRINHISFFLSVKLE